MSAAILCFFAFFNISCENPFIEKAFYLTTITFNTNGGSDVPQQKLLMGEAIARPADPVKGSSVFLGWYTDNKTFDHEWDFTIAPEKNMILYARWDEVPNEELPNEELTLILDTSELENNGDSVSFSASGAVLETSASGGDIITVFYMLADSHDNNWFSLSINGERVFETYETGTGSYNYTVNYNDANNGVITIHANSLHSDLNLLLSPDNVHFDKTGKITFDAHVTNPTGTTFSFTLFRDNIEVDDFTNMSITSGTVPAGIVNEMLRYPGEYHVIVWAKTDRQDYMPSSDFNSSPSVHVYNVSVTISNAETGETVSVSGHNGSYSTSFNFNAFSSDTVTLTAVPVEYRYVTWTGDGTGEGNTRTINNINANRTVTAAFAAYSVTVSVNGGAAVNHDNLAAAFTAIGTEAGDFTVTLYANQTIMANRTINTENQHITIVGAGVRTITHGITTVGTHLFTINNANASLTLGNNITIQGRSAEGAGAGAVVNNTNGTFRMLAGSKITGHQSSSGTSAAVNITGANSTFEMSGGIINGNNTSVAITTTTASGGVYFTNGTFNMSGGSITGNTQGAEASDVYHATTATNSFTISGNAAIGALKLNAANITTNASVIVTAGWEGGIATLNLRGTNNDIVTASAFFTGKTLFSVINTDHAARIGLGQFISSNNARQNISPLYCIGTEGADSGRLVFTYPTVTVFNGAGTIAHLDIDAAFASIGTQAGNFTVTLLENQTMNTARTINMASQSITITGSGSERIITHRITSTSADMFTINAANASLTLGNNITIRGRMTAANSTVITITNGTFTMQEGSVITGHQNSGFYGAVLLNGANARFIMTGGEITANASTFYSSCTFPGGVNMQGGIFTMSGGRIHGNTVGSSRFPADVYRSSSLSDTMILSGSAEIGSLCLPNTNYASESAYSFISIGGQWQGKVDALYLSGSTDLATSVNLWEGKTVVRGASGHTLTTADMNRIGFAHFSYDNINNNGLISNSLNIITSGADIGKLIAKYSLGDT